MTTRRAVEASSERSVGDGIIDTRDQPTSVGRGTREDGSGSTTPHNRAARAGEGPVPDRQLNIRTR